MTISILGIDIGRNSCSVVGVDDIGSVIVRRTMGRQSRNTIAEYLSAGMIEPKLTVPKRPSKQRRTLKQLHADLTALGFTGSYGRVAAFAREWRVEQQKAGLGIFVPLSFRPGEAFQFDWSEVYAVIGGERTKLQVTHVGDAESTCSGTNCSKSTSFPSPPGESHMAIFELRRLRKRIL